MNQGALLMIVFFILFTAIPGMFAYSMFVSKSECELAVMDFVKVANLNHVSADKNEKQVKMYAICKAMGIEASIYLHPFGSR